MTRELKKGSTFGFFFVDKFSKKFYLSGKFRMENDRPNPPNGRWVASPKEAKEVAEELKRGVN